MYCTLFVESYLISPHGYQKKVLDFLSRLTNLAIHITLDGSALMIMHSGNGLNDRDIEIMQNVISKATQQEEKLIKENAFSINEFETIKK